MSHLKLVVNDGSASTPLVIAEGHFYRTGDGKLVQIHQTIAPGTINWHAGYRFIDHNGVMYNEAGVASAWLPKLNLVEEIDALSPESALSEEDVMVFSAELEKALKRHLRKIKCSAFFNRNFVPFCYGTTTGILYVLALLLYYSDRRDA